MGKRAEEALTDKQRIFVKEYLTDFNGTRAAVAAGYGEAGAAVEASRLLRNAKVQELLAAAIKSRESRLEKNGDDVLRELMKIAFSDMLTYVQWDDDKIKWKASEDLPAEVSAAIMEVSESSSSSSQGSSYSRKFRLYDKVKALELLAKHFGVCNEKKSVELTGKDGKPVALSFTELVRGLVDGDDSH